MKSSVYVHGHTLACESVSVFECRVFLVNFNSLVQLDFRGVFHTRSCIKSVLTGVFFSNKVQSKTEYTICVLQIIKWKEPGERERGKR